MKFENTHGIRKSINYYCAQVSSCFPTSGNKKASKRKWTEGKDLYLGDISGTERVLVAVHILTDEHKKPLLMDAVLVRCTDPRTANVIHPIRYT